MKKLSCLVATIFCSLALWAVDVETTLVISNVQPNKGSLTVLFFSSSETMKKNKPAYTLTLETETETVTAPISLVAGEYFITAYQDLNNNDKLDTNFIGIPREPVGIANYSGSGIPGGFEKHKLLINIENPTVTIVMKQI